MFTDEELDGIATKEEMKKEAISRMKEMGVYSPVIVDYGENDNIQISEPPMGACYWLDDEQNERVKKIEEKFDCLVYHAILSITNFGKLENYLVVSQYKDEWADERIEAKGGIVQAWVENLDYPDCSEMGDISVELTMAGGLKRTA